MGPTAVGKTETAMYLARLFNGQIISADSMQVYQGMDIGTAKPSAHQQKQVKHHMIDIRRPDQSFNAADYAREAGAAIRGLLDRGITPIVCGGTGLYINSLMDGFLFPAQGSNDDLRQVLYRRWEEDPQGLHRRLAAVDPTTAARLHPNDARRVIRALEVHERTGIPFSRWQMEGRGGQQFSGLWIGLTRDRQELYRRMDARVDAMIDQGLMEEVKHLWQTYPQQPTALQALGYKELVWYFQGWVTLSEAVYLLKRNTRRYGKRQLSWFRRDRRIHWFNLSEGEERHYQEQIAELCRKLWA